MPSLRGTLVAFDSVAFRATVRLDASPRQSLSDLPVSRALPAGELVPGRRVLLSAGEGNDPAELVLIAAW